MKLALLSSAVISVLPSLTRAQIQSAVRLGASSRAMTAEDTSLSMALGDIELMGRGDHGGAKSGKVKKGKSADSGTSDDDSTPCSIEDLEGKDFLFSIYPSVFGFGGYLFREPVLLRWSRPGNAGDEDATGIMNANFLCSENQPQLIAAQSGWVRDGAVLPFTMYPVYEDVDYAGSTFVGEYNCKTKEMLFSAHGFYNGFAVAVSPSNPGFEATEGEDFCYTGEENCGPPPTDKFTCP